MRNFFILAAILFSTVFYSQKFQGLARFASQFNKSEEVVENPSSAYSEIFSSKNFTSVDKLNHFVFNNLDVNKVEGKGKHSTVLSLEIDDSGILKNVSAIGSNESLNEQAIAVFKKYEGQKMTLRTIKDTDLQIHLPITVDL